MQTQNKYFGKATQKLLLCSATMLLAACSGNGFLQSSPTAPSGETVPMPKPALLAICQHNPVEALAILSEEPMASPADTFFTAVALEKSGHATKARQLYAGLMQSPTTENISIICGNETIAHGLISEEAGRRLASISRDLALLDVNMRPAKPLHAGLPHDTMAPKLAAIKPAARPARAKSKGPVTNLPTPVSNSPFGQWFVHLSSYRSTENAMKNTPTLEAKYPAFKGFIDQWEVDSRGTAIRLGVRVSDKPEADSLCAAVKNSGNYCAVMDTTK